MHKTYIHVSVEMMNAIAKAMSAALLQFSVFMAPFHPRFVKAALVSI